MLVLLESGWQRHDDSLPLVEITLTAVDVTLLVLGGPLGAVLGQVEHHTLPHHAQQRVGVGDAGEEGLGLVVTPAQLGGDLSRSDEPGAVEVSHVVRA